MADPNEPKPAPDEANPSPEEENLFSMSEEPVDEAEFPLPDRDFLQEAAGEGDFAEPDLGGELPQFDVESDAPGEVPQFDAENELAGELPPLDADEFAEPVSTGEPAGGAEPAGPESDYLAGLGDEGLLGGAEEPMAEELLPEPELAEAAGPKRPPAWLAYLDWAGAVLLLGGLWAFSATMTAHLVLNGVYLTLLVLIPFLLWKLRGFWTAAEATPLYTVMLAVSVVAILTAAYCLGLALARYEWQWKVTGGRVAASTPDASAAGPLRA